MTEDRRKDSFAVEAVKRVGVGVTDAGRLYLDKDFTGFWAFQVKLDDFKRFFCFERDSGTSLHLSHLPSKDLLELGCSYFEFLVLFELSCLSPYSGAAKNGLRERG